MTTHLKEDAAGGSVSAGSIAGNRGYSIFGQKSKPMKRVIDKQSEVPVIKYKMDSRKLKSFKRKGDSFTFGFFVKNQHNKNSTNENFNLSDALSKISNVTKQSLQPQNNTTQFGLEDDKGNIIKVYVDSEYANEFEKALQQELEDNMKKIEIAELLFNLRDEFNIINVVWPKIHDDAVEEEEQKTDSNMEDEFNNADDNQDPNQKDAPKNDPNAQTSFDGLADGEKRGAHDVGEDDIPVDELPTQQGSQTEDEKATLSSILAMLASDAEAKKADADARAAEARAKEAEAMARAAEAKIKSEEQILDMEAYNKQSSQERTETRKLAKLAKYRHDIKREKEGEPIEDGTVTVDADQHKRFEEEENHISKIDGKKSYGNNNSITFDTLMKIVRHMQSTENSQE